MAHGCDLPQELIDVIIDFLHDDNTSLSSCSLVVRAWLAPSHFHKFRVLKVQEGGLLPRFTSLLENSATIARSIQDLCFIKLSPSEPIDAASLLSTLARLPALHTLGIWYASVGCYPKAQPLYAKIPKLRLLAMYLTNNTAENFVQTIALFSKTPTDQLYIHNCTVHEWDSLKNLDISNLFPAGLWQVGSLFVRGSSCNFFLAHLPRLICAATLRTLDIDVLDTFHARDIFTEFLAKMGSTLHRLRWDVTALYARPPECKHGFSHHRILY